MKITTIIFAMSLLLLSCKKENNIVKLDKGFNMVYNQTVILKSENLAIQFIDITDSRCPVGGQCVWEGEGILSLNVNNSEIHVSTLEPTDTLGYTFTITDLSPYPNIDSNLSKEDYKAELVVTK
jgi:hypothetical protein